MSQDILSSWADAWVILQCLIKQVKKLVPLLMIGFVKIRNQIEVAAFIIFDIVKLFIMIDDNLQFTY